MKAAVFEYVAAKSVADAVAALGARDAATSVIAGGQSLVPMLNLRVAAPDVLVDIGGLEELRQSSVTATAIRIGALTTHAEIEDGGLPDSFGGLLPKLASEISYRAVRNYGTLGGSVALADPAADWPVCLLALGSIVRIAGKNGVRQEPIGSFLKGQYETSLARDEIIVGFDVPRADARLRWGRSKVVRKSGAFAESLAVVVDRGGGINEGGATSVALGAAASRPQLLPTVAARLGCSDSSESALRDAIGKDLAAIAPGLDGYGIRLHTSTVLRAIRELQRQ